MKRRLLKGRKTIYTNEREINDSNIVEVLQKALSTHLKNRGDIQYLHDYVRGIQPILNRVKVVRPEICNKIVINRANEIVTFKTANFIGEPLQYVSRGSKKSIPKKIETLNSFMLSENKHSKDMRLAEWMFVAGVSYRLILRDKAKQFMENELLDEAPFEIYTLDPRYTFVVRSNDVTKRILMGVTYVYKDKGIEYTCYTKDAVYYVSGYVGNAERVISKVVHNFGIVPIVEYQCNSLRMGAFEIVIDLLDALNLVESNRLDGVEQFVQGLMVFENVDITTDQFGELRDMGAIKIRSNSENNAKVYYINEQLDQGQTQTLVDDLYQIVLQIVGMPSQGNANTSDSSNNGAVIMKNGWWNAEARAKETEGMWKEAETDFLKIILRICNEANALDLKISDIEQKFSRRSYEDKLTKVQSFTTMMGVGAPPIQAFKISGLVTDPESESIVFEQYQESQEKKMEKSLKNTVEESDTEETVVTEDENAV